MGEAEDIIRARERELGEAAAPGVEAFQRRERQQREELVAGIRREAATLLSILRGRGYPDGTLLKVYAGRTLLGGTKRVDLAGWKIMSKVYLLSDGQFAWTGWETSLLDLDTLLERDDGRGSKDLRPRLDEIAAGLASKISYFSDS